MPASNAPETPRQRLIGLMYILLLCMLALNVSSDVLRGFELVDDSLTVSTENSSAQNRDLYLQFTDFYRSNPEKTKEWYVLSQTLKHRSDSLYNYIDDLKWRCVREADGKKADIHDIQRSDNLDAAGRVMLPPNSKRGKELRKAIDSYRAFALSLVTDPLQRKIILNNFSTKPSKRAKKSSSNWEYSLFENMPLGAVVTMFTKMQNDIRYTEGEVLHTLINNVDVRDFRVNQIKAYVIPNSENVVMGNSYKANIILSAEDSTQRPSIFINGRMLDPSKKGRYEVFASKPGVFQVEGFIEMKRGDGSMQRHRFAEKYTVVEPTATVSNTLMNVLYAGIANEVSISVPGVPDNKISAVSNNGSLSRSSRNWIAKPSRPGQECMITVTALMDGKSQVVAKMPFRVRPLPEPRPFLEYRDDNGLVRRYKGGTGFKKTILLTIPGIVAALDDDLLEVNFRVLSFKTLIYDSMGNTLMESSQGASFSDQQKTQIRGLARGKRLWISNVKAVGPDGIEQSLSPMEVIIN